MSDLSPTMRCGQTCLGGRAAHVESAVEPLLGELQIVGDQGLHGVRGTVDLERQLLALGRAVVRQHEICGTLPSRRSPDAGAHAVELTTAQRGAHRLQPVVAVVTAAQLGPQRPEADVQLIVDGDDPVERHLVEGGQGLDRSAGLVHEAPGPTQYHSRGGGPGDTQATFDHIGATGLVGPPRTAHSTSQLVSDEIADVVAVSGVRRTGVSQSDHEPHVRAWDGVGHGKRSQPAVSESVSTSAASDSSPAATSAASASPSAISWSEISCSIPASASASSSSASTSSAVGACTTLMTRASSSVSRSDPSGSTRSLASTWKPASASSTEISMYSGMFVASASTLTVFSSVTVIASALDSPVT